jgi:hypothetical protein
MSETDIYAAAAQGRWREFYDRMRVDMIEAQCAIESGKLTRASELIDSVMRNAKRCEKKLVGSNSDDRQQRG